MPETDHSSGRKSGGSPFNRRVIAGIAVGLLVFGGTMRMSAGQSGQYDDGDDDDGGLSGGEIAAISVGGVAGAYGIFLLAGGDKDDDDSAEEEKKGAALPLPEKYGKITASRLVPSTQVAAAGRRFVLDLQVQQEGDKRWYSVSKRSETQFGLQEPCAAVVPVADTRNLFAVSITAPKSNDGRQVTAVGRFAPANREPVSAQAVIRLAVAPGSVVAAR
jgi:hypothetical protein